MGKRKNKKIKDEDLEQLNIYKGIRKTWEINPKTRVVPNKKKKSRKQEKREFQRRVDKDGYE